jgi:NADH dehydrogenase FAD-containing subunit
MSNIVIIGGSYAGTKVAHKVLKDIPQAKVTLIDPSDVFYFNIASPRIIAKPNGINFGDFLIPIADKFKQYPPGRFTFIRGVVSSIDFELKAVQVSDHHQSIPYDYLVVASGSSTPGTIGQEAIPFKPTGENKIRQSIEAAQQRVAKADDIIIVGAGPVGVETAGEIAQAYPKKKVTLVASHDRVLPALKPSASKAAEKSLGDLGVKIMYTTRVVKTTGGPSSSGGTFNIQFDDGNSLDAALVISAAGNIPNTSFMPRAALDPEGWINVDAGLRIASVTDGSAFALGDVTTFKQRYMLKVQDQIPVVAGNLKAAVSKLGTSLTYDANDKLMVMVPVGSKTGTGQIGGWVPFGFMVAFVKGRDYFMSKAASYISAA